MKIVSVCLLFFTVFVTSLLPAFAHTDYSFPEVTAGQINEALFKTVPLRFLPSHPLYFLISIKEKVSRIFQPSSAKRGQFDFVLSGKRLKESYLLLEAGDVKNASKALANYVKRIGKMNGETEKARSQNQDVTVIAAEIADGLKNHETLLFAIYRKWQLVPDGFNFDKNFQEANNSFISSVMAINNVMPGVKDRFKMVTESEIDKDMTPIPSPTPQILEATPTARPRRIIY